MASLKPTHLLTPLVLFAATALMASDAASLAAQDGPGTSPYVPPAGHWEVRSPEALGMDAELLARAIEFAIEAESTAPRDLALGHLRGFGREPLGDAVGPFRERGDPSGVIVRNGYIVAEWGDPHRVDNTFSVTKSFLAATVGLAWDRDLIPDLDEPVAPLMAPVQARNPECVAPRTDERDFHRPAAPFIPFQGEHAEAITWDHLLRQTSDWAGTLWCKPDWADRPAGDADTWGTRERHEPGTRYEYNDVRVNLLALAALNVWRDPLPRVLREHLMDPIGASPTWRWTGYDTSWVLLDGEWVQSVSGGAHWGGGMFISARDMARFGLLHLRQGKWGDRQILSEEWLEAAVVPGEVNPGYGFMNYFLNVDGRNLSNASEGSHHHAGAGSNIIYVDPEHDLVVVVRWIRQQQLNEFIGQVLAALDD